MTDEKAERFTNCIYGPVIGKNKAVLKALKQEQKELYCKVRLLFWFSILFIIALLIFAIIGFPGERIAARIFNVTGSIVMICILIRNKPLFMNAFGKETDE